MRNDSGLHPVGVAVLIEPYEPERRGSMIVLPQDADTRAKMVDQRAIVVEAGPAAWHDEAAPRAQPGDKVMVTRYAGMMAQGPRDGKMYRLVNDRDIFCRIVDEEGV